MGAAVTATMDRTRGAKAPASPEPAYRKLQPRWCGLSKAQVVADQRRRLYEAMVEIVATSGPPAATIKAVCALACVSRQTFYDLFGAGPQPPREACFLDAYDYVVDRAVERVGLAYRNEQDPELRLQRAFERFALEAAGEPLAARFALVEALGAGRTALARMDRGRRMFEQMLATSIGGPARDATLSSTIAKGIVGGVEHLARGYLLAGRIDELPAVAGELSRWASSYRPWARPTRAPAAARPSPRPALRGSDDGLRILRAAAAIAARDGYAALSVPRITRLAGVDEETFASLYDGADAIEACFLAAFELLSAEALVCAAKAAREASSGWPDGVRRGITALMDHMAGHPFLGPVAFVEIFSAGPSAIERRSRLLGRFAEVLVERLPDSRRPSAPIAEAIVGGIGTIVYDYVVRGQVSRLHELADDATYLALAPVIGHEAAVELILSPRPLAVDERDM